MESFPLIAILNSPSMEKTANEDKNNPPLPFANLEQDFGDAPLGAEEAKGLDTRLNIRVISYRKLKHDPDGVSVKAVLDGLVRRGVLTDDSTEQIKEITFESRKSKTEKTVVEISSIEGV